MPTPEPGTVVAPDAGLIDIPGPYPLRESCKHCGSTNGRIEPTEPGSPHCAVVLCADCDRHGFFPRKDELNVSAKPRAALSRRGFKTSVETRVFARDGGRCFLCGELPTEGNPLEIGHIVSRKDGLERRDWTVVQVDHEDNLVTLCKRHNLGLGSRSLDPAAVAATRAERSLLLDADKTVAVPTQRGPDPATLRIEFVGDPDLVLDTRRLTTHAIGVYVVAGTVAARRADGPNAWIEADIVEQIDPRRAAADVLVDLGLWQRRKLDDGTRGYRFLRARHSGAPAWVRFTDLTDRAS